MTLGQAGMAVMLAWATCGVATAQQPQPSSQSSSHLGQVAKRHGGEESNTTTNTNNNNVSTVPGQHTPAPGAAEIRGGNGIVLPEPPPTEKHPVTGQLHGETITDNYRWLEKQRDPATRAWLDEQNAYTDTYLDQVKIRPQIQAALAKLEKVETYSIPVKSGELYFFKKRLAEENQGSIYVRHGVAGKDERLVDAGKLSADQNTSAGILDVTQDGTLMAYGIRQGGADEQSVHVMDVAARQELKDQFAVQRYMGVQFSPDKKGLYYSVFHHEGTLVYWHVFGTEQSADKVIFGKQYKGEPLGELDLISAEVSDNGHWLILTIARGVPAKREDILLKDLRQPDAPIVPLVYGIENRFRLLDTGTDDFLVQTDLGAPRGRILRADPQTQPQQWQTVVPEAKDVVESSGILGSQLFVQRLADVKSEITIYALDGKQSGTVALPGIGSSTIPYGRPRQQEGFYSFQSFNVPPAIYRYQVSGTPGHPGSTTVFAQPKVPFDPGHYEVRQVFYTSKDGTRVPMFIAG